MFTRSLVGRNNQVICFFRVFLSAVASRVSGIHSTKHAILQRRETLVVFFFFFVPGFHQFQS